MTILSSINRDSFCFGFNQCVVVLLLDLVVVTSSSLLLCFLLEKVRSTYLDLLTFCRYYSEGNYDKKNIKL